MASEFAPASSGSSGVTNALMVVAVLAVALSVVGIGITASKVSQLTGNVGLTDQGNATLEIQGVASIEFTNNLINWSIGRVDTTCGIGTFAVLNTNGTNVCSDATAPSWNVVSQGLVVENIGNTDVSLELLSDQDAATFIGGINPVPLYQWAVSNNEAGSCAGTLSDTTYTDVATTAGHVVCDNFLSDAASDALEIDLLLRIPTEDVTPGQRVSTITATATAL